MSALQQLIETHVSNGTRSYSGEGMAGETCLAFEVENHTALARTLFMLGVEAQQLDDPIACNEIKRAVNRLRTAQMGRDIIAYFPGTKYEEPVTTFDPAQHVLDIFGDEVHLISEIDVDVVFNNTEEQDYAALMAYLKLTCPDLSEYIDENWTEPSSELP